MRNTDHNHFLLVEKFIIRLHRLQKILNSEPKRIHEVILEEKGPTKTNFINLFH